ncbi:hypothetical protein Sjap_003575 [Stephania japonica]|uniref:Telomerase Cajal body protein 1 n=1 Tax=Stephania japonica TaxID=461633 RepID=A0AAP0KPZ7_9MAGN
MAEEQANELQQKPVSESEAHAEPVEPTEAECGFALSWPVLRFDVPPRRTSHFYKQFRSAKNPNNFFKGVKWSPDGSCFLTSSDDNAFRLFDLPSNAGESKEGDDACSSAVDDDSYVANLVLVEGESVYDYCWYPYMSASDPNTCVFASTTRDHPIHLWDANSGQAAVALRCTYRAYDSMDEITAALSIAFNPTGSKSFWLGSNHEIIGATILIRILIIWRLFAGYNKSIRVFDLHRPGRDFEQYSTIQGNKEGQSGIISALAFCPAHSGMLAAGSYSQTTAIYREDNMELLYVLHGQEGGITHDPYILCWDIRNTVDTVYKLYRYTEATNQRIFFDIEPCGRHLGTGGQDGQVHIYDLLTGQWMAAFKLRLIQLMVSASTHICQWQLHHRDTGGLACLMVRRTACQFGISEIHDRYQNWLELLNANDCGGTRHDHLECKHGECTGFHQAETDYEHALVYPLQPFYCSMPSLLDAIG